MFCRKKLIILFIFCIVSPAHAQLGGFDKGIGAKDIQTDTLFFDNNLTVLDTDVQTALETLDELVAVGGSGGGCFELDGNSDLMPVADTCTDTLWEEDGNGDLQPQA